MYYLPIKRLQQASALLRYLPYFEKKQLNLLCKLRIEQSLTSNLSVPVFKTMVPSLGRVWKLWIILHLYNLSTRGLIFLFPEKLLFGYGERAHVLNCKLTVYKAVA